MQNLGLGVLEQRNGDESSGDKSDSEDEQTADGGERDVLGRLMGQKREREAVGIEVVDGEI